VAPHLIARMSAELDRLGRHSRAIVLPPESLAEADRAVAAKFGVSERTVRRVRTNNPFLGHLRWKVEDWERRGKELHTARSCAQQLMTKERFAKLEDVVLDDAGNLVVRPSVGIEIVQAPGLRHRVGCEDDTYRAIAVRSATERAAKRPQAPAGCQYVWKDGRGWGLFSMVARVILKVPEPKKADPLGPLLAWQDRRDAWRRGELPESYWGKAVDPRDMAWNEQCWPPADPPVFRVCQKCPAFTFADRHPSGRCFVQPPLTIAWAIPKPPSGYADRPTTIWCETFAHVLEDTIAFRPHRTWPWMDNAPGAPLVQNYVEERLIIALDYWLESVVLPALRKAERHGRY
jgi:hypothetical protein